MNMLWHKLKLAYRTGQESLDTDGCTGIPDNVFGVNLYPCCAEHDFYYRNYLGVSRWKADRWFALCVFKRSKPRIGGFLAFALSAALWVGVRIAGGAYFHSESV